MCGSCPGQPMTRTKVFLPLTPTLLHAEVSIRAMKTKLAFAQITIVLATVTFAVHAQSRRPNRSFGFNVSTDRTVTDCRDIQVTYDRQPAITDQSEMTLAASQVSTLRTQMSNGGLYITGWDRSEYSVKTCRAVPNDPDAAAAL